MCCRVLVYQCVVILPDLIPVRVIMGTQWSHRSCSKICGFVVLMFMRVCVCCVCRVACLVCVGVCVFLCVCLRALLCLLSRPVPQSVRLQSGHTRQLRTILGVQHANRTASCATMTPCVCMRQSPRATRCSCTSVMTNCKPYTRLHAHPPAM